MRRARAFARCRAIQPLSASRVARERRSSRGDAIRSPEAIFRRSERVTCCSAVQMAPRSDACQARHARHEYGIVPVSKESNVATWQPAQSIILLYAKERRRLSPSPCRSEVAALKMPHAANVEGTDEPNRA